MSDKDIIRRIRKLLALAENAGSEAEAAIAVERARELMQAHNYTEAQVRASQAPELRSVEEIIKGKVTDTSKKVAWHMRIAGIVDELYGCHAYWQGGKVMFFGRISAVQAATYTTQYLMREVEQLTDREAPTSVYSRKFRNAFRLGCADRIRQAIRGQLETARYEERKAKLAEMEPEIQQRARELVEQQHGTTIDNASDFKVAEMGEDIKRIANSMRTQARRDLIKKKLMGSDAPKAKASDQALALLETEAAEVKEGFDTLLYGPKNPKTGKRRRRGGGARVGSYSSGTGYEAGHAAGAKIKINASRGGLPRGQDSLP